jgi:hypothetical protein
MDNVHGEIAHRHRIAILEPTIRLETLALQPETHRAIVEPFDPEAVGLMRTFDRHLHFLGQHPGLAAVIHVAVGEEDLLERDAGLLQRLLQLRQVSARIDQRAFHRLGAPDQRAVLLESSDGDDADAHREFGCFGHAREMAAGGG